MAEIDTTIRSGVEFRGTKLWVLIFAILIASVGLNDSGLMRSVLFNLGLAAFISLLESTLYSGYSTGAKRVV